MRNDPLCNRRYRPDLLIDADQRNKVRQSLKELMRGLVDQYQWEVAQVAHCKNIELICEHMETAHKTVLTDGKFLVGRGQKVLNLFLKWQWCLGEIPEPPHCPLDSIVLWQVPELRSVRWTTIATIGNYVDAIDALRENIGRSGWRSLAKWELEMWNQK